MELTKLEDLQPGKLYRAHKSKDSSVWLYKISKPFNREQLAQYPKNHFFIFIRHHLPMGFDEQLYHRDWIYIGIRHLFGYISVAEDALFQELKKE